MTDFYLMHDFARPGGKFPHSTHAIRKIQPEELATGTYVKQDDSDGIYYVLPARGRFLKTIIKVVKQATTGLRFVRGPNGEWVQDCTYRI
jgi:hypothetical protein